MSRCAVALYNPALGLLNISVQDAWISSSTSNTRRRHAAIKRLVDHGGMDEVVVGVKVRACGAVSKYQITCAILVTTASM
jgi:hypothetical protein